MSNLINFAPEEATYFDPIKQLYCVWDNALFYFIKNEWVQDDSDERHTLISLENINERRIHNGVI